MSNKKFTPPSGALGTVSGQYKPAITKFRTAPVAPFTEAMRMFQTGRVSDAERLARKVVKASPRDPEALHLLGLIAFQQGQSLRSADYIGKAIAAGGNNPAFQANHGLALKTAGKLEAALAAYDRSLSMDAANPGAWNDRGNVLSQLGQPDQAETSYRRSLDLAPRDAKTWANLGNVLVKLHRADDGVGAARKAIELAPNMAAAHNGLGNALNAAGKSDEAITAFKRALAIEPDNAEAMGNLASCLEATNRTAEARELIENSALKLKDNPHLALILAQCNRRDGNLEAAAILLEKINRRKLSAALRRDIAFELSRLYDRLENPAGAFATMAEGNQQMLIAEGVSESLGDSFIEILERLPLWYTTQRVQSFAPIEITDNELDPVFLVGFPRSGTTLLGQILDSHSALVMLEERPMLETLVAKVRATHGGYPEGIETLGSADVAELRRLYFEGVDAECERKPGQQLIDKFPLHLVHIGLILRIFPKARFIFALRHPCDAVLSCFMQSFTPNAAMANFFSMPRAARTYDLVMGLWQHYETLFDPEKHFIRYEDVVADFDGEVSRLLAFLGLDWEDGVRDYATHARAKGRIDTPSYHQVTEAIYTRARYRWLRYEAELKPVLKTLMPWARAFGYGEDA